MTVSIQKFLCSFQIESNTEVTIRFHLKFWIFIQHYKKHSIVTLNFDPLTKELTDSSRHKMQQRCRFGQTSTVFILNEYIM